MKNDYLLIIGIIAIIILIGYSGLFSIVFINPSSYTYDTESTIENIALLNDGNLNTFATINFNQTTTLKECYQETATQPTCGGMGTGTYSTAPNYLYITYSKPEGATAESSWKVKHGEFTETINANNNADGNYAQCWNANPDIIKFRIYSAEAGMGWTRTTLYCHNGNDWIKIGRDKLVSMGRGLEAQDCVNEMFDGNWDTWCGYGTSGWTNETQINPRIYEEAMIWKIKAELATKPTSWVKTNWAWDDKFKEEVKISASSNGDPVTYSCYSYNQKQYVLLKSGTGKIEVTIPKECKSEGNDLIFQAQFTKSTNLFTEYSGPSLSLDIKQTYYRLEDNKCTEITLDDNEVTENDYLAKSECEIFTTNYTTASDTLGEVMNETTTDETTQVTYTSTYDYTSEETDITTDTSELTTPEPTKKNYTTYIIIALIGVMGYLIYKRK